MIRRRIGRPDLLGTVARTAVITGTATAVSNRMRRGAEERAAQQQSAAEAQQRAWVDQAAAQGAAQAPTSAPVGPRSGAGSDRIAQLTALVHLKAQGILTEAEFAQEKARILGS